ncbi:sugar phosphate nucleotidyltransferase [Teredinibacter sp. KSP-S5-2]|uniref:sugar phosphate nucleotidyltransferase n=1 Tax=Teredinibacter sp. KSP-S5-2 TaxID=3034506 RepID=UPI0029351874|nr:sugar phosphate nucleotidyltransferase [Teredinibacter sp. KSP-S5-2]WNO07849.1 sugar phosphate nucleotidyltransferase [Teredinibacter sp. KSP-S5-2]
MKDISQEMEAVLLAGGKGTRLRPLTLTFPKPLVPLGHKPIIEVLLNKLKNSGIFDVTISTGYLPELIKAVCGNGDKFGLNIQYSHEQQPLGTAGPIGLMEFSTEHIIVMNGDLLTTMSFKNISDHHLQEGADVTIGVYQREVKIDFGVVDMDENSNFIGFQEKPVFNYDVSMGVNILSKRARDMIVPNERLDMPDLIMKVHNAGGKVSCYREDCYWLDIGRMDDYAQAQEDFENNEHRFLCS